MKARELIEADAVARVLPAKDAAAFPAMVATLEKAKGLLAGRCGADRSGTVGLGNLLAKILDLMAEFGQVLLARASALHRVKTLAWGSGDAWTKAESRGAGIDDGNYPQTMRRRYARHDRQ